MTCVRILMGIGIGFLGFPVFATQSDERFEPATVKRRIEPNYPNWAYANGVSKGYAEIAFYVDERGRPSEFLPVEYSHEAFAEELRRVVSKWKFVPAHYEGMPIKSVCRTKWEFLPSRPVVINSFAGFEMSRARKGEGAFRKVSLCDEEHLDMSAAMLQFPAIYALDEGGSSAVEGVDYVLARCNFYLDTDGGVNLPVVEASSSPELNESLLAALKSATFERPMSDGKPTTVWLRKTYKFPVLGSL